MEQSNLQPTEKQKIRHTSIIIGFPSFIAFFKSPAKPLKQALN
jgi:hypothetical protein